ncbi:hypothetical protein Q3G72_000418 [Acer saccharum]|nr:hypothetical protein Q3G72_000418 [Acer saccharum]
MKHSNEARRRHNIGDDATSTTTTATATRGEAVLEQHDDEALVLEPAQRWRREGRRFGILIFGSNKVSKFAESFADGEAMAAVSLPTELIVDILSYLPVKCICRFKYNSKWTFCYEDDGEKCKDYAVDGVGSYRVHGYVESIVSPDYK